MSGAATSQREAWKSVAETAARVGVRMLSNALMPGVPIVGQVAGAAASEVLAQHLGVSEAAVPQVVIGSGGTPRVQAAMSGAHEALEAAGGYGELRLPRNFAMHELEDKESHQLAPPDLPLFQSGLDALQELRTAYGRPMTLASAWRSLHHSIEARKPPHALHRHTLCAFDIRCHGQAAYDLLKLAIDHGWSSVGPKQHGAPAGRYLHVDRLPHVPPIWTYP